MRPFGRFGLPTDRVLRSTLYAGVLLRFLIFKPLYPINNDDHSGVIRYFPEHHLLPAADVASQGCESGAITGVASFTDFDVPRLVVTPFERRRTLHSGPLLLYATTWYSYTRDSNFGRSRRTGWKWVVSLLCLAGIVPTMLGLIGLGRAPRGVGEVAELRTLREPRYVALGQRTTATVLLLANGFDAVVAWWSAARRWLTGALVTSYAFWGVYYVVEVAAVLGQPA